MEHDKWFLLNENRVLGPFPFQEIEMQVEKCPSALIWGRGQTEWLSFPALKKSLQDEEDRKNQQQQPSDRLWRVRIGEQEYKPVIYQRMIDFLKTMSDLSDVRIWTDGYNEWKEIFQIHKILDELGVSRRAHPRVPIMGTLQCEGVRGTFTAHILSISEGGLGITDAKHVRIGERMKVLLKSPNLFAPIHASAEVVFIGNDGYAGLKFSGLQSESKSAIIEYIRKYTLMKTPLK